MASHVALDIADAAGNIRYVFRGAESAVTNLSGLVASAVIKVGIAMASALIWVVLIEFVVRGAIVFALKPHSSGWSSLCQGTTVISKLSCIEVEIEQVHNGIETRISAVNSRASKESDHVDLLSDSIFFTSYRGRRISILLRSQAL